MNNKFPLVSIGVASYNNSKYVIETLDSITAQVYPNLFLIIVDDCSNDTSVQVIEEWIKANNRECLFIKNEKNLGISAVGNSIYANAKGKYLSFIASDDCLLPNKILQQVTEFEKLNDEYALVYGDTMKIGESGETLEKSLFRFRFGDDWNCISGDIFLNVVQDFFFYTHSALVRINSLKQIKFKFDGKYISEDWYMQLKLAQRFKIFGTPILAAKYRIISTSMGARFWNAEKIHVVLYSQFMMFNSLFYGEVRNSDRWRALVSKLRYLYSEFARAKNRKKFRLYNMARIIYFRTRKTSDLKNIVAIDLGRKIKAVLNSE